MQGGIDIFPSRAEGVERFGKNELQVNGLAGMGAIEENDHIRKQ